MCSVCSFKVSGEILEVQLSTPNLESARQQTEPKATRARGGLGGLTRTPGRRELVGEGRGHTLSVLEKGRRVPGSLRGQGEWEDSSPTGASASPF